MRNITHNQMVQEIVDARLRADGGTMWEVVIKWDHKPEPSSTFVIPREANMLVRSVNDTGRGYAYIKED